MTFNWQHYIALAEVMNDIAEKLKDDVSQEGLREACLRSAISRSYYGVFCAARNLLRRHIHRIPEADTHKFVRDKYLSSPDPHVQKVHHNLLRLWKNRKIADYEDELSNDVNVGTVNALASRTMKRIIELESEAYLAFSQDI